MVTGTLTGTDIRTGATSIPHHLSHHLLHFHQHHQQCSNSRMRGRTVIRLNRTIFLSRRRQIHPTIVSADGHRARQMLSADYGL